MAAKGNLKPSTVKHFKIQVEKYINNRKFKIFTENNFKNIYPYLVL